MTPALGVGIFAVAAWVLYRELSDLHWSDVRDEFEQLAAWRVLAAVGLTILGYLLLSTYDVLGMRYIGHRQPTGRVMFAALLSYIFSNNVGLSVLGATAVRLRLYTSWGVPAVDVARLIAFTFSTFYIGVITLCGLLFVTRAVTPPAQWGIPDAAVRWLGLVLLLLIGAYLAACAFVRGAIRVRSWQFRLPHVGLASMQPLVGMMEWLLVGTTLYVLIQPSEQPLPFFTFLGAFMVAQAAGLISHVPGGIGVFESAMVLMMKGQLPEKSLMSAVLAYRLIYYLLPLAIGSALMGVYELQSNRRAIKRLVDEYGPMIAVALPQIMAFITFIGGVVLMLSAATPDAAWRLDILRQWLPLWTVEIAHGLSAMIGALLMVLALGLSRRVRAAFRAAAIGLGLAVVCVMLKGWAFEVAVALLVMLALLLPSSGAFHRRGHALEGSVSATWLVAIVVTMLASLWIGLFVTKHVAYRHAMWWQFAWNGDAPRFLRSMVLSVVMLIGAGLLVRRSMGRVVAIGNVTDEERALPIVAAAGRPAAHLALTGDKQLMFDPSERAFLMYAQHHRSFVAMGDPVGPHELWEDLLWRYVERAARADGLPVFYAVAPMRQSMYIDMGLTLMRIGDEAKLDLATAQNEALVRDANELLGRMTVVEGDAFWPWWPRVQRAARRWADGGSETGQAEPSRRDRAFAFGRVDGTYLSRVQTAIWTRDDDTITAFATLWPGASGGELGVDLLRPVAGRVDDSRRCLLAMLRAIAAYGRALGYGRLSLGLAPLEEIDEHPLAPLWKRGGPATFALGEHFDDLPSLRQFVAEQQPIWEPRYLASTGSLGLAAILGDVMALILGREV